MANHVAILYKLAPMDRYVVFGNPVSHSLSPEIHAHFARASGQPLDYQRHLVPLGEFASHARAFFASGGRGANVTLPFKVEAFDLAHSVSARARLAGAVNVLVARQGRIEADNTDGAGLVADLTHNLGIDVRGKRVLLLGAGGAARGVIAPLLSLAPAALEVANRTPGRAAALARQFESLGAIGVRAFEAASPDVDLVINATSTSTHGEPLVLAPGLFRPGAWVYDMAYGKPALAFLELARAHGARVSDGLGMLVEQAAESFEIWRGVRPDTTEVLARLRAQLS